MRYESSDYPDGQYDRGEPDLGQSPEGLSAFGDLCDPGILPTDRNPDEPGSAPIPRAIATPRPETPRTAHEILASLTGGVNLVGDTGHITDVEKDIFEDVAQWRAIQYDNESSPTENDAEIEKMARNGLQSIGAKIGTAILLPTGIVHYFDTDEHYAAARAITPGLGSSPDSVGTYALQCGILFKRASDPMENNSGQIHEHVHAASRHTIEVDYDPARTPPQMLTMYSGLYRPELITNNDATGLAEATTNMAMLRTMKDAGQSSSIAHAGSTIMQDAMIQDIAVRQGMAEEDAELAFYKAHFADDLAVAAMLRDSYGDELAQALLNLPSLSLEDLPGVASRLSMPTAMTIYNRIQDTGYFDAFMWQPDNR
jgi:hypothetical protein